MKYKVPPREDYQRISVEYRQDYERLLRIRRNRIDSKAFEEPAVPSAVWDLEEGSLKRLFVQEDWNDDIYYINEHNFSYGKSERCVKTVEDYKNKQTVVLFSPSDFRRITASIDAKASVVDIERLLIFRTHVRLHGKLYEPKSMESFTYDWLINKNKSRFLL